MATGKKEATRCQQHVSDSVGFKKKCFKLFTVHFSTCWKDEDTHSCLGRSWILLLHAVIRFLHLILSTHSAWMILHDKFSSSLLCFKKTSHILTALHLNRELEHSKAHAAQVKEVNSSRSCLRWRWRQRRSLEWLRLVFIISRVLSFSPIYTSFGKVLV